MCGNLTAHKYKWTMLEKSMGFIIGLFFFVTVAELVSRFILFWKKMANGREKKERKKKKNI